MKRCPNCRVEVEDNFDICWNCQYSFVDERVLNSSDFKQVCQNCQTVINRPSTFCPNCGTEFENIDIQSDDNLEHRKDINCLRCNVPLNYQGNFQFRDDSSGGIFFDLLSNHESFDLYYCPNCGKVEFFLPNFG